MGWSPPNKTNERKTLARADFRKELKAVKFENFIYAIGNAVIAHIAKKAPEQLRKAFISFFDENNVISQAKPLCHDTHQRNERQQSAD